MLTKLEGKCCELPSHASTVQRPRILSSAPTTISRLPGGRLGGGILREDMEMGGSRGVLETE